MRVAFFLFLFVLVAQSSFVQRPMPKKIGDWYYYVDSQNKIIDKLGQWDTAGYFLSDFAAVWKDGQEIYLDKSGNSYPAVYNVKDLKPHITAINLKAKKLEKIPDEVFENEQLRVLILQKNSITEIPSDIGKLLNLEYLDLETNLLKNLPTEIGLLKNLYFLDLENNFLTNLPETITQLKNLKILNLYGNDLDKQSVRLLYFLDLDLLFY